jgi:glycosyltransferase involved in cell wall biosynthesis
MYLAEEKVREAPASDLSRTARGIRSGSEGKPAVLMSHPTGNQNVRNALLSLVEHNMLAEFWTSIAWNPNSRLHKLLPSKLQDKLARRAFMEAPRERIRSVPWREMIRLGAVTVPLTGALCSGERPFSVIGMYRHFDRRVARRLPDLDVDVAYAHEGGALETFRAAKRAGVTTVYELPSSYWYWEHKLLSTEAERNPGFAALLPKLQDSAGHMAWKDEELRLADVVVVPSEHVRATLAGVVPDEKVRVIGYGAPTIRSRNRRPTAAGQPIKVLFVGSLTQRKGIGYLLEAVGMLGSQVELTLVGQRFSANREVDQACSRWRWVEALPHSGVMDLMQEADVLVLPSLAEGCALVVLEALACGLPVIVTPNTGSLEFVCDGREGFVVPICSADAIADRLDALYRDRDLLAEMSRGAVATAESKSWKSYRDHWAEAMGALAC